MTAGLRTALITTYKQCWAQASSLRFNNAYITNINVVRPKFNL